MEVLQTVHGFFTPRLGYFAYTTRNFKDHICIYGHCSTNKFMHLAVLELPTLLCFFIRQFQAINKGFNNWQQRQPRQIDELPILCSGRLISNSWCHGVAIRINGFEGWNHPKHAECDRAEYHETNSLDFVLNKNR